MKDLTTLLASLIFAICMASTASAAATALQADQFANYQSEEPADGEKKKTEGEEEEPEC